MMADWFKELFSMFRGEISAKENGFYVDETSCCVKIHTPLSPDLKLHSFALVSWL
jgi:hypothetical protein